LDALYGTLVYLIAKSSVADPGFGAFLTPGSGMEKNSDPGSGIRDKNPGSATLEKRKDDDVGHLKI
jgi:hypothetical protein